MYHCVRLDKICYRLHIKATILNPGKPYSVFIVFFSDCCRFSTHTRKNYYPLRDGQFYEDIVAAICSLLTHEPLAVPGEHLFSRFASDVTLICG